ncbi:hypothetical protein EVAR_74842_1 [Eumeta japonica]|uniref:Uncharacterized protein n=1 Tax=Eumeta variegata TaxID=151549 RepID=A0A4C1SRZ5_EUMVA|nr:hypothetical protein EVAR_74842_1 [Eumeta japonica]
MTGSRVNRGWRLELRPTKKIIRSFKYKSLGIFGASHLTLVGISHMRAGARIALFTRSYVIAVIGASKASADGRGRVPAAGKVGRTVVNSRAVSMLSRAV